MYERTCCTCCPIPRWSPVWKTAPQSKFIHINSAALAEERRCICWFRRSPIRIHAFTAGMKCIMSLNKHCLVLKSCCSSNLHLHTPYNYFSRSFSFSFSFLQWNISLLYSCVWINRFDVGCSLIDADWRLNTYGAYIEWGCGDARVWDVCSNYVRPDFSRFWAHFRC